MKLDEIFTFLQEVPECELKGTRFITHKQSFIVEKEFYIYFILIAFGFTIARYFFYDIFLRPILKKYGLKELTITKYQEALWQFLYYSFSSCICIYAALTREYFWVPWKCWELPFPQQPVAPIEFWIYTIALGWYLHQLYAFFFIEIVKKDYWEMLIHHLVTLILLFCAYSAGYFRIGVLVIFHTDLCDVILHFVKLIKLVDENVKFKDSTKNVLFALLPISWFFFRIVFLFDRVIWTAMYAPLKYGGWQNTDYYVPFNGLLLAIYVLQLFWFYIIMKIACIKVFLGKDYDDLREVDVDVGGKKSDKKKPKKN